LFYCLGAGSGALPCYKIFDCYWEMFDVEGYLRDTLSPGDFARLKAQAEKPPEKMASLLEVIAQTKTRAGEGD
jgi:hypothetical protein